MKKLKMARGVTLTFEEGKKSPMKTHIKFQGFRICGSLDFFCEIW